MKTLVILTGTGRSGTSLLANKLDKEGVYLGTDLLDADNSNLYGYYEDKKLLELNKHIFEKLSLNKILPVKKKYFELENYNYCRRHIKQFLETLDFRKSNLIAIKDPKISNILGLWLSCINKTEINTKIVICYRNFQDFEISYNKTVSNDELTAINIWSCRNLQAFYDLFINNFDFEIFDFDNYKKDESEFNKILKFIKSPFKKRDTFTYDNSKKILSFDVQSFDNKIKNYNQKKIDYNNFGEYIINSYDTYIKSDYFIKKYYKIYQENLKLKKINKIINKSLSLALQNNNFLNYKLEDYIFDEKNENKNLTKKFRNRVFFSEKNILNPLKKILKKKIYIFLNQKK